MHFPGLTSMQKIWGKRVFFAFWPAQENASQKRIPKCIAPIITWFVAAPKPTHRSNSSTPQCLHQRHSARNSDSSTWNSTLQQHPPPAPSTSTSRPAPKHTRHSNSSTLQRHQHARSKALAPLWQQHPQASPCSGTSLKAHTPLERQHPQAAPCSGTCIGPLQSARTTLTAAPCCATGMPAPKRTPHRDSSTLLAAAPRSSISMPASKCTHQLWQQHPAAGPACPLQTAHTTLTAAPSSSTLQRYPAAAPALPPKGTHHSDSNAFKQHPAAAPTCLLQNADMQLLLYLK